MKAEELTLTSSRRITSCFEQVKQENRAALVTFTMACDPDYQTSLDILLQLPDSGADIIELGMPFSDPMADGVAIQAAGRRALKNSVSLDKIFSMVETFRKENTSTPIILMGYCNPVFHYGEEAFVKRAAEVGVDGFILVDLPPEEDSHFHQLCQDASLALVKLITPTTDMDRFRSIILPKSSGFLYYVSVRGVTGTQSATLESVDASLSAFREHTDLPIAVGFGIKTAQQAASMSQIGDAVVVGSALVQEVESSESAAAAQKNILDKVQVLSTAVKGARGE